MADGNELVLSELKDIAKTHRASFAKGFQTWKDKVEKEGEQRGYLDPQADRMAFAASAFAFVAIVAAGAAAVFSGVLVVLPRRPGRRRADLRGAGGQAPLAGGGRAARPVRGPRALPQGLRPARREAAGRRRAVGAVPRLRGRVRHRRPGRQGDDASRSRRSSTIRPSARRTSSGGACPATAAASPRSTRSTRASARRSRSRRRPRRPAPAAEAASPAAAVAAEAAAASAPADASRAGRLAVGADSADRGGLHVIA